MAIKKLTANKWHKVVAPAANTVYITTPRATGLILQYGATAPQANDNNGLWFDKTITLNAGLTAWIRPALNCTVFATDTAGADPMTDTPAPLHLTTDLPAMTTATAGDDVSLKVVAAGGTSPYSYKWYYNPGYGADIYIDPTDPGVPGGNPNPSAATATLVNHAVDSASSGLYRCVISDATGDEIASMQTTLVVTAAP